MFSGWTNEAAEHAGIKSQPSSGGRRRHGGLLLPL